MALPRAIAERSVPMSLSATASHRIAELLSNAAGAAVDVIHSAPITEGWSAQLGGNPWPWVFRCTLSGGAGVLPSSVIVKLRRPDAHLRSEPERLPIERAALEFLTALGTTLGPRLVAADTVGGMLIMEDLGTGPALEDLLVGADAHAAEDGLLAFATALGQLHARTAGHAAEYYRVRQQYGPIDPLSDRVGAGGGVAHAWQTLQAIVAKRRYLPPPDGVDADLAVLLDVLAQPGPYLAFSNGDTCPQNCRLTAAGPCLIDWEHAGFRHALLDATALRFPFGACPCWSRLPELVGTRAEAAYRAAFAPACPEVLDPVGYEQGLTVACAAWTIERLVRLPKLEQADVPHPMGFSRRGQVLDAIATTRQSARVSGSVPRLASWLGDLELALRRRWPHLPPAQPHYPVFQ